MADFKEHMKKLTPEKKEQLGDSKNSTEYIMNEIYSDEELLDKELNMVSGGVKPAAGSAPETENK